jgi:hypothetical protein
MTRRESGASRDRTETMTMPGTDADVIDALVGIEPGSSLDAVRARRPEARTHAQASYRALFEPGVPGAVTAQERFALGTFVAGLHGEAPFAPANLAAAPARRGAVGGHRPEPRTRGPCGLPPGPLSRENTAGPPCVAGRPRGSARGWPPHSSTCTCSSSTLATPRRGQELLNMSGRRPTS